MKTCTKCGESKPLTEFAKRSDRPSGVTASCKACRRLAMGQWRVANPERVRQYREDHRAEMAAYVAEWQRRNPDKVRAASLAWYHANKNRPEIREALKRNRSAGSARYRARKRGVTTERIDPTSIWERDNGRCHFCGKRVSLADMHLDHLIPISQGGSHSRDNVGVAHATCNQRSGAGRFPAQLLLIG